MNLLSMIDFDKSPGELLEPVRKEISEKLGKPIDVFSMGVDLSTSEYLVIADGKQQREKSKTMCIAMKMAIKLKLGKKAPSFKSAMIHYNKGDISIALHLLDGTVQNEKL